MSRLKSLFSLLKTNLSKTIWFNFKMLPFKQAIRFPIYIYGKATFRSTKGEIVIDAPIGHGMIKIGKNDYYVDTSMQQTIWTLCGKLIFHGPVNFLHGTYLLISDNATMEIGTHGTFFGTGTKLICFDNIIIGDNVQITWDCQLIDTSFHYIELMQENNKINPLTKPVIIGNNIWIGNRTTISKGTILPDYSIVASNSLVNKDFSDIQPYSLFAGCPAKSKGTGFRRVFDYKQEKELDEKYNYVRTHL